MEERYGLYRQGSRALRSMRNGDFQEGDVWDVLNRREDYNSVVGSSMESSHFSPRRPPSAARMIGRVHGNSNPIHEPRVVQQSAPVKIPDWSKIYGENSKKASSNNASWLDNNDGEGGVGHGVLNEGDDSGDDDDDETKLPPHEWLAKKYARSQISSFSVFEGVGRTLKGRDLSRVCGLGEGHIHFKCKILKGLICISHFSMDFDCSCCVLVFILNLIESARTQEAHKACQSLGVVSSKLLSQYALVTTRT